MCDWALMHGGVRWKLRALRGSFAANVDFANLRDVQLTTGRARHQLVSRTLHAERAPVEDVGIHHRCTDVLVTE